MNYKALVGQEVIAIESGRKLGQIDRILIDPDAKRIDWIVVRPAGRSMLEEPGPMKAIAVDQIRGLGEDVVTVPNDEVLQPLSAPANHLVAFAAIKNEAVMTEGGKKLGEVSNIEFDEQTLDLESIEISQGLLSGKSSIPVTEIISVGEDVIVVRDMAHDEQWGEDQTAPV